MNCCDYKCNQGRDCPARKDKFPGQIIPQDDEPIFTLQSVLDWVWGALAGIGLVSALVISMFLWGYYSK